VLVVVGCACVDVGSVADAVDAGGVVMSVVNVAGIESKRQDIIIKGLFSGGNEYTVIVEYLPWHWQCEAGQYPLPQLF
jgi:hypothetical protein